MSNPTVTQTDTAKDEYISFRCKQEWKRRVASIVALRGETMQAVCIEAISKHLKIDPPKADEAAA